ncbi:MAG: hypothetical protein KIT62_06750 [Cyclobacteriaceae bacterium]|nr:hypothetical protein [Cyclobacteriaceae bacterium]
MKNLVKFCRTIPGVAVITLLILSVPFVAMQFTNEVNWSVSDFVIMGILVFSTMLAYVLISRYAPGFIYRAAIGLAIGATFLMVWANLAVGLIGSGPHAGNLMYIGVVAVVIVGTYFSKLAAKGMELVMFGAALSLMLLAAIALLVNMQAYPGSSVGEIIGVNAFFVMLYTVSGLLFRYIAPERQAQKSAS